MEEESYLLRRRWDSCAKTQFRIRCPFRDFARFGHFPSLTFSSNSHPIGINHVKKGVGVYLLRTWWGFCAEIQPLAALTHFFENPSASVARFLAEFAPARNHRSGEPGYLLRRGGFCAKTPSPGVSIHFALPPASSIPPSASATYSPVGFASTRNRPFG